MSAPEKAPSDARCALCAAREKALAEGTWDVHFRSCSWCGAWWPAPAKASSLAKPAYEQVTDGDL